MTSINNHTFVNRSINDHFIDNYSINFDNILNKNSKCEIIDKNYYNFKKSEIKNIKDDLKMNTIYQKNDIIEKNNYAMNNLRRGYD